MTHAYICDAIRTPFGRYGGALSKVRADDLGAIPLRALMARNAGVDWDAVDDVIFGCANQAGEDNRNVARMSALLAGLPVGVTGTTITLEEKEFGVGLKFTPTVLDGTRVNLKLVSEVSELAQTGSPFTTVGGITSVLPSITSRRVDTTVQLNDGQSFAIAGLLSKDFQTTVDQVPLLGSIPIIGALFRSTKFKKGETELLIVVTPRLVAPIRPEQVRLPTDRIEDPRASDVLIDGEGYRPKALPPASIRVKSNQASRSAARCPAPSQARATVRAARRRRRAARCRASRDRCRPSSACIRA